MKGIFIFAFLHLNSALAADFTVVRSNGFDGKCQDSVGASYRYFAKTGVVCSNYCVDSTPTDQLKWLVGYTSEVATNTCYCNFDADHEMSVFPPPGAGSTSSNNSKSGTAAVAGVNPCTDGFQCNICYSYNYYGVEQTETSLPSAQPTLSVAPSTSFPPSNIPSVTPTSSPTIIVSSYFTKFDDGTCKASNGKEYRYFSTESNDMTECGQYCYQSTPIDQLKWLVGFTLDVHAQNCYCNFDANHEMSVYPPAGVIYDIENNSNMGTGAIFGADPCTTELCDESCYKYNYYGINVSTGPSSIPSSLPSWLPTVSYAPSMIPSLSPSSKPSQKPSPSPSLSALPSSLPSARPSKSAAPSANPSTVPSFNPSSSPTRTPSDRPSASTIPTFASKSAKRKNNLTGVLDETVQSGEATSTAPSLSLTPSKAGKVRLRELNAMLS